MNSNSPSLLTLNDDCLFAILKHLNFDDQVNLASTCSRLDNIFQLLYKTTKSLRHISLGMVKYKSIDYAIVLPKIGHYLEKIKCFFEFSTDERCSKFIQYVTENCINLRELKIELRCEKYPKKVVNNISRLKSLKHLQLKCGDEVMNDILLFLPELTNLEHLDLTKCDLEGTHLDKLVNLKTLILENCNNFDQRQFITLCSNAKNIKELNVRECDFDLRGVQAIVDNLKDLEILAISSEVIENKADKINQMKKLNSLTVYFSDDECFNEIELDTFLEELAKGKNDLEVLKIIYDRRVKEVMGDALKHFHKLKRLDFLYAKLSYFFIANISKLPELNTVYLTGSKIDKEHVLILIDKCPSLSFIDITYIKDDIKEKFIKNVISILKTHNRPSPLELRCHNDEEKEDGDDRPSELIMKNDLECLKGNHHLLKLNQNETEYEEEMNYNDRFGYDSQDSLSDVLFPCDFGADSDDDYTQMMIKFEYASYDEDSDEEYYSGYRN